MSGSVGKPIDRVEGRAKVTGKAVYAAEVPVANVVHAVIVGSTVARAKITSLDAAEASHAPGVLAVLTPENAPRLPGAAKIGGGNGRAVQLLQDMEVRYADQPIAVVVADTLERALHAAGLVRARYHAVTPRLEIEAERAGAKPGKLVRQQPADSARGDADAAFAAAPVKVEATYTTAPHTHNPMEMHATLAVWPASDRLTVYDSTQGIFEVRNRLAECFGLDKEKVRVISKVVGGGFGSKGSPWSHVYLAALAAQVVGRPVKLMVRRPQMFSLVGHRTRTIQRVKIAAGRDGKLAAIRHDVESYTSSFDEFAEAAAVQTRMLYACPAVATSHRVVPLDVSTPTFTRAPGLASGSVALESALDELAVALRMDPLELRVKNHASVDPQDDKPWSSKSLLECYRQGAERFGWARRKPAPRLQREGKLLVGWGMATATYPSHMATASALAKLHADGTGTVLAGTQEIGTGTTTIMTQIAADALGLPVEKVRFDLGDTLFPENPLSAGSRTAASTGSAVRLAAEAVRLELAKLAAGDPRSPLHGVPVEEIDGDEGVLSSRRERSRRDSYAEILGRAGKKEIEARVESKEIEQRKQHACHAFGAQFVEVKVDEQLGQARVTRAVGAFGGGRILNAKTARSQLIGGIVWGIGLALLEEMVRDGRSGRVVTRDLADYHVPVHADVPPIDIIMIPEDDSVVSAVGAKGLGEIGIVGVGAAVANAVFHATGKRIRDLPITVDKLIG